MTQLIDDRTVGEVKASIKENDSRALMKLTALSNA